MTSPLNLDAERAAILAAARALADRSAEACNVDKDDNWKIYCDDFIADAEAALLAARSASAAPNVKHEPRCATQLDGDMRGPCDCRASAGEQPVAVVDANDDGLFVDILYGPDGSPLKIGDKLYRAAPAAAPERLQRAAQKVREAQATVTLAEKDCPGSDTHHAAANAYQAAVSELTRAALAQTAAPAEAVEPGIEAAARYIEKQAEGYINENASTESDTGAVVWHYGQEGCDYYNTLTELAEEIRTLKPAAPAAHVPDGWRLIPMPEADTNGIVELGWAYLDAARKADPTITWSFSHAGYRAILTAALAAAQPTNTGGAA